MKIMLFFVLLLVIGVFYLKFMYKPIKKAISYKICKTDNNYIKDSIKLLSWNIHKEYYEKSFQGEYNSLIKKLNLNLILLQEYNTRMRLENHKKCSYEKIFAPNTKVEIKKEFTGIINISKVNSIHSKAYLTKAKEIITNTPKVFLITQYKIANTNKILSVANIHAINFQIGLDEFKKQIDLLMNTLNEYKGAKIIAGDFNTWSKIRTKYLIDIMKEYNMYQVSFQEGSKITQIFNNKLDYIFYTNTYLKIIKTNVIDTKTSDHAPLYVEFRFRGSLD